MKTDVNKCSAALHGYPALVRQRTATTCGQCVVAMVLGISRAEAIERIGHGGITSDAEVWMQCGTESGFVDGHPPDGVVCKPTFVAVLGLQRRHAHRTQAI